VFLPEALALANRSALPLHYADLLAQQQVCKRFRLSALLVVRVLGLLKTVM
jgi:hypothetical protein